MVDDNIANKISEIVDNYLNDNKIVEEHKEINVNRKNISENEIKPLFIKFFEEKIKIDKFKTKNDSLNKKHNLWGFKGIAGAMFFNQIYNAEDDKERLEREIRSALLEPDDFSGAKLKIDGFSNYIKEVGEKIELHYKSPAPKSSIFFLSYFWHIQAPDKYPIFYPKSRKVLKNLGLFDELGRDDYGDIYVEFLNKIEEISQILKTKKSKKFSFDEIGNILAWYIDKIKEINVWVCPIESCDNLEIAISRNNKKEIELGTWKEITIHILEHLNKNIIYFGPSTVEKFLEECLDDFLFEEDKQLIEYERKEGAERAKAKDVTWKNRMRSALAQIKIDGYIETDKNSDDDIFQSHYRSRRRTEKFFNDYKAYDDWSDIEEGLKIEYALRDEKVNIFAMTKGTPSSKYTHQVILCKKSMITRLGPFVLDPKTSKPEFELSDYGKNYQNQIWEEDYDLIFIAYVESQIKIKISYELFVDLEKEGFFVIWHPDAPFSYFKDKEEGYLVLFKIYIIDNIISETLLNKGRRGRNYYYSLEQPIFVKNVEDIIPDNQFNVIKQNLINLLKQNKSFIEIIENPVFSDKHFIWQMIKEASENLAERRDGIFTISEIKDFILKNYGDVNENTIESQIIVCTVNHDSRIHYPENKRPRIANSKYDFLYRLEKGKGELELYSLEKHGIWEIKEDDSGNLIVAKLSEEKFDIEKVKDEFISNLLSKDSKIKLTVHNKILIEEILKLMKGRKQIILTGPPGTGKTYLAKIISNQITNGNINHVNLIQFHPEYCYENFIECLQIKSGSNLELEQKAQIFRRICREAFDAKLKVLYENYLIYQNTNQKIEEIEFSIWFEEEVKKNPNFLENNIPNYVLIIDEINRGDLSRIFGEAIMGLEYRNTPIITMYFKENQPLIIPDNLYIIGTMNSVDRSIAILDYALRRRFLFYEVKPNREILEEWLEENNSEAKEDILKVFDRLNDEQEGWIINTWIDSPQLAINYRIGHTYFFHKTREQFQSEWEYSIVPLLLEYMNFSNDLIKSFKENFDLKDPFIIP